jgi:hypothetical protein
LGGSVGEEMGMSMAGKGGGTWAPSSGWKRLRMFEEKEKGNGEVKFGIVREIHEST